MIESLFEILEEEAGAFRRALGIEARKREAILAGRAKELQDCTRETEGFLNSLEGLHEKRQAIVAQMLDDVPADEVATANLTRVISHLERSGISAENLERLKTVVTDYRNLAVSLQKANSANQKRLERANQSVSRVMGLLKESAEEHDGTYAPHDAGQKPRQSSLILNANA